MDAIDAEKKDILTFLELDFDALKTIVENATKLEDDEKFFEALSAISFAKSAVNDALDDIKKLEQDAKGLINTKAKALYGPDWQTIKGQHFKIGRQFSGSVYELLDVDKVDPDMVKVAFSPNTDNINGYREANDGKLPDSVALNEHRTEVIKIAIK